jgi:S-formylglutathione hydrolase FrmB
MHNPLSLVAQRGAQAAMALALLGASAAQAQAPYQLPVDIVAGKAAADAGSGRLLLLFEKVDPAAAKAPEAVDADPFGKLDKAVAAREVAGLTGGAHIALYPGDAAYPVPLDRLPAGDYWVQAVLDRDHSYSYSGRGAGDVVSQVARISMPRRGAPLTLNLDTALPSIAPWEWAPGKAMFKPEEQKFIEQHIKPFAVESRVVRAFTGRAAAIRGYVVTPPGYDESAGRYPVVYFTHGFQAGMRSLFDSSAGILRQTSAALLPPMIWVMLDQSGPAGTHEFADSVNNGPWGRALTEELLPEIDRSYRTDPHAGRFIMGHSSGGWAALWVQITYPALFRGAWASSPDYADFTDFDGVDITRADARVAELRRARMEAVLGEYGGQESSFDWVFSPRGPDGRPLQMYDRATGLVNREVADYWRANWDLSQIIRNRWPALKRDLDGKIHVIAGDKDEFRLDVSARKLEDAFKAVGGNASFTFLPGKGHFDLYSEGDERMALRRKIGWQIWNVAYPQSALRDPGPPASPAAVAR